MLFTLWRSTVPSGIGMSTVSRGSDMTDICDLSALTLITISASVFQSVRP